MKINTSIEFKITKNFNDSSATNLKKIIINYISQKTSRKLSASQNLELSNLQHGQGLEVYGESQCGFSVASIGKINDDNYTDLVIGAYAADQNRGKSYILYGGVYKNNIDLSSLTRSQGVVINGLKAGDQIGWSVASAGDINRKDKVDILIGAKGANYEAGNTYLLYSENLTNIDLPEDQFFKFNMSQGILASGSNENNNGWSVVSVGDVNRDDFDDFLVGVPGANFRSGKVYLIYGSKDLTNIDLKFFSPSQGIVFSSSTKNEKLRGIGCALASAGDVDGDGIPDLLIGYPAANSFIGKTYLIFGKACVENINLDILTSEQGIVINGANTPESPEKSGWSLSSAGDIDGDKKSDFLIGAPGASSNTGKTYLIFGQACKEDINLESLRPEQGIIISGVISTKERCGWSVSSAGDIDGDKIPDFLIGAPFTNSFIGKTYLIFGKACTNNIDLASLTIPQGIVISSIIPFQMIGWSVSSAGDIDGDKIPDILIGAPLSNYCAGKTYLIYGKACTTDIKLTSTLPADQAISISSSINENWKCDAFALNKREVMWSEFSLDDLKGDKSGWSVAYAGDVNGDNYNDILIGAPGANEFAGKSYLIYGNKNLTSIFLNSLTIEQGIVISSTDRWGQIGWSVASIGDINGDHITDSIIGAPWADANSGKSYLVLGNHSLTNMMINSLGSIQPITIKNTNFANSGWSVASAGDVNNDELFDFLIGAPNAGYAYLIYGSKNMSSYIDLRNLNGGITYYASSEVGCSLAGVGDVNNDGVDDFLIGAYGQNYFAGNVYLVYGTKEDKNLEAKKDLSTFSIYDGVIINGASAGDYTGYSVSSAGDVNGDQIPDFIIGAPNANSYTGKTYLIYGTKTFSTISNIVLASIVNSNQGIVIIGQNYFDYSGHSVGSAGDVNGDGKCDLLIGAPGAISQTGKIYVIFGSNKLIDIDLSSLSESQGYVINGASMGDKSGWSVASAGFFNNDIFSDIIIGAPGGNKSYIIYGSEDGFVKPVYNSNFNKDYWWFSDQFRLGFSLGMPLCGFIVGWIFREKIAMHVLDNWGYSYNLLYSDSKDPLQLGEVGLRLLENQCTKQESLICKIRDKYVCIEVDNGNNNGISEGLYNNIVEQLKMPFRMTSFHFLQSEKNQIRDFLLTRPGFINYRDLGCIKGTIYKLCLNSVYRHRHELKYKYERRLGDSDFSGLQGEYVELATTDELYEGLLSRSDFEAIDTEQDTRSVRSTNIARDDSIEKKDSKSQKSCVVMSIDAMIDPEHIRLQNEEFVRLSNQLMNFVNEGLPNDINWLLLSKSRSETLFLEPSTKSSQTVEIYEGPPPSDDAQFFSSNNLMLPLLTAKQILYNLPLLHYLAQNSINYLSYNITLPDPLDNKELLISVDLVLGSLVAQYLPDESIMNGMLISTASTASYAVRMMAADYLKNQKLSEEPVEFAMQCASTVTTYSLPGVVNYALTKAILPDAKMSISTLDVLGRVSFGVVQCYNNYKAVYSTEAQSTTADIAIPYIADTITLWSLRGYLNFDVSNTANLMMSIKNTMSVAATTYAAHCVSSMVMDALPQEVKVYYIDPVFDFASNTINDFVNTCYQSATDVGAYIAEEISLIMEYVGMFDLKEDA